MDRGTCWSITINNPEKGDYECELPAGWKLTGQLEVGEQGTEHYQGMLKTNQVRFSAVKKVFPRAHIELAKNAKALEKYVHKVDTRSQEVRDNVSTIPTLFEYQGIIANMWVEEEFQRRWNAVVQDATEHVKPSNLPDMDVVAMRYVDSLVATDIENGRRGAEFIGINPMWRSSWKLFWRSIIKRRDASSQQAVYETSELSPDGQEACDAPAS